jgi:5-(carboxyamino)imidazole ribonucleotide synthase
MIAPGAWLGVVGGGQLGRMFAMAAHRLGYQVMVLDPAPQCSAGAVADRHLCAAFDDPAALDEMARTCAAVTVETENVPTIAIERLARDVVVRPSAHCVAKAQDRIIEKRFISELGLSPAPYAVVTSAAHLDTTNIAALLPGVLKLSRFGYDGKGQAHVNTPEQARAAFESMGGAPCVLERRIDLRMELSVVLARGCDGSTALWPVAENRHRDGILDLSIIPARIPAALATQARNAALTIAEALDYQGVLCVEFFVDDNGKLLVNEFAPRPHNSGHGTLDASHTSQFEQQVRTLAGLPLGDTTMRSPVVIQNLLGDLWDGGMPRWQVLLADSTVALHLYGKTKPGPGRKMGHFSCIAPTVDEALDTAIRLRSLLPAMTDQAKSPSRPDCAAAIQGLS